MSRYSRTNDSAEAVIYMGKIIASGTFKNVWEGIYTEGTRKGQKCVAKRFKTDSVDEEYYFAQELSLVVRAQKIIDEFHKTGILRENTILLNTPSVWIAAEGEDFGKPSLIEPMITNFEKFNSNTGWAPCTGNKWGEVMQALSHFSYHNSNRELLLCDLQGGAHRGGYILTDPAIMSRAQNCGPADLGQDGINSFFQRHKCGFFCSRKWVKPVITGKAVFPMREGTSMTNILPPQPQPTADPPLIHTLPLRQPRPAPSNPAPLHASPPSQVSPTSSLTPWLSRPQRQNSPTRSSRYPLSRLRHAC